MKNTKKSKFELVRDGRVMDTLNVDPWTQAIRWRECREYIWMVSLEGDLAIVYMSGWLELI